MLNFLHCSYSFEKLKSNVKLKYSIFNILIYFEEESFMFISTLVCSTEIKTNFVLTPLLIVSLDLDKYSFGNKEIFINVLYAIQKAKTI